MGVWVCQSAINQPIGAPPPRHISTAKTHLCQKWRFPVLDPPCSSPFRPRPLPSAPVSLLTTTISSMPGRRYSPVCGGVG